MISISSTAFAASLPKGFVYVKDVVPDAVVDMRYATHNNFTGKVVDGYLDNKAILTTQAAQALARVQKQLETFGLVIKILDAYRPQQAVDGFVRWGKALDDTSMKAWYYPTMDKQELFDRGYIAAKSSHSRGSTVDLTLTDLVTGEDLDMGTHFDYFGRESWPDNPDMSTQARANRALLRQVMEANGFSPLKQEWWHFTLKNEPFPDTYFNFPVE